ncbi:MAG: hypothetical protein ACYCVB_16700 [Bacilli bacterium]
MKRPFTAGLGVGLLLAAMLYGAMNAGQTHARPERPQSGTATGTPAAAGDAPRSVQGASPNGRLSPGSTRSASAARTSGATPKSPKSAKSASTSRGRASAANGKASVRVVIVAGRSVQAIADQLARAGVIQNRGKFVAMAAREPFLRAGVYEFHRNEPLPELLYLLTTS